MKSSCLLTRREGTTRQAFHAYYESAHAPLGMKYFPFKKYLRNHVVAASGDINFDVIMECYFNDQVNVSGVDAGDVRTIMDVDERHFMNQRMIRSARVEERVLSGPAIGIAAPGTRRQMLLLNPTDPDIPIMSSAFYTWGGDLAAIPGILSVSLDTVQQQEGNHVVFPYTAILSLWFAGTDDRFIPLTAPSGIKLEAAVLTDVCETTPAELAARYAP